MVYLAKYLDNALSLSPTPPSLSLFREFNIIKAKRKKMKEKKGERKKFLSKISITYDSYNDDSRTKEDPLETSFRVCEIVERIFLRD